MELLLLLLLCGFGCVEFLHFYWLTVGVGMCHEIPIYLELLRVRRIRRTLFVEVSLDGVAGVLVVA